ncbi:MAG: N(G),N(G)-dimethylarginine dimethylaminohydrolase [bacterium]|nr:N(G),N(G)-dimethylarginine dimethylaminohydrolase [bacterium]
MFKHAIVKTPGRSLQDGITSADLGVPDFDTAVKQHEDYTAALKRSGLGVTVLEADDGYPDSVFVEDPAVLIPECAVITRPGAAQRRGECDAIETALRNRFDRIERIESPAVLDGGDVLQIDDRFFVGLSARTDEAGVAQFAGIVGEYGYSVESVTVKEMLHLKSGAACLADNTIVLSGEFVGNPAFADFRTIALSENEAYCANCIRVNDFVVIPAGYPMSKALIENEGFSVIEVDVSEYRKLDGGISCLSLRF